MKIKLLEVRDASTFIPVMAIQLGADNESQRWLLSRSGYGGSTGIQNGYVLFTSLKGYGETTIYYDHNKWFSDTLRTAHAFVRENFDYLNDGDVIDVQFIKGETLVRKVSERLGSDMESSIDSLIENTGDY